MTFVGGVCSGAALTVGALWVAAALSRVRLTGGDSVEQFKRWRQAMWTEGRVRRAP